MENQMHVSMTTNDVMSYKRGSWYTSTEKDVPLVRGWRQDELPEFRCTHVLNLRYCNFVLETRKSVGRKGPEAEECKNVPQKHFVFFSGNATAPALARHRKRKDHSL